MIILILVLVIIFLLAYIYFIKKELINISDQLNEYNDSKTRKKLDINIINKELEMLAESINKHINISNDLRIKEINSKEELKDMISNISHDLRTPLTSIIGYIQIIKRQNNGDKKEKEYLDKIEKRAKSLQSLLEDFFMLSVIESSSYDITLKELNIKEIVCESVLSFYEQFEERNIEPILEIEEVSNIYASEKEIKRIIENLIINIIKHSSEEVKIKAFDKEDEVILLMVNKVKDKNNIDTNRLFDKFYKGNDTSRKGKNTGLGLSIVKTLIEKMNGEVEAYLEEESLHIKCRWKKYS